MPRTGRMVVAKYPHHVVQSEEKINLSPFPFEGGTFVVFLSHAIPHEVLETQRERYSVTGWFRTRE